MARDLLRDQLISIYHMKKCPLYTSLMNTAKRLHRYSHLFEAIHIRFYKPELNKVLINRQPKENSDE